MEMQQLAVKCITFTGSYTSTGSKEVIWVDFSFKHNNFNNINKHSNALLVVVIFLVANPICRH